MKTFVSVRWDSDEGHSVRSFEDADSGDVLQLVTGLIEQLDGGVRTLVTIEGKSTFLGVGGDAKIGLVSTFSDNDPDLLAQPRLLQQMPGRLAEADEMVVMLVGGQPAEWPSSELVERSEALEAADFYVRYQEPLPGITWKTHLGGHARF